MEVEVIVVVVVVLSREMKSNQSGCDNTVRYGTAASGIHGRGLATFMVLPYGYSRRTTLIGGGGARVPVDEGVGRVFTNVTGVCLYFCMDLDTD